MPEIYAFIGPGNGLLPIWCQAIAWANADLLSIGTIDNALYYVLLCSDYWHPSQISFVENLQDTLVKIVI